MKYLNESIICAGFGGQGIMTLAKVFANSGMEMGLDVTWMPSYGAEVRGGTAHAMVRIKTGHIGNPSVREANTAVIMNTPSLEKFEKRVKPGGLIILNTSMVTQDVSRGDVEVVAAPFTDEALKLGNLKVANMVAAGVYIAKKKIITQEVLNAVMHQMASGRKELIDINKKAVARGIELANT